VSARCKAIFKSSLLSLHVSARLGDLAGLDLIVLAGTDLTLLFDDTNTSFPFIDCAALHIAAIAEGLLGEPIA
jgi:aspartate/glutamate racemase